MKTATNIKITHKKIRGFSLMELVLAIAIFAIGSVVSGNLLIDANTATRIDLDKTEAIQIAKEGLEAVASIRRDQGFDGLTAGSHGLVTGPGGYGWAFSGSSSVVDTKFTRSVIIDLTTRTDATGTTSDSVASTTSTVSWTNARNATDTVSLSTIFTNWRRARPGE